MFQEHVVRIVVKLLSPPVPPNPSASGSGSHLIGHMPMLSAILFGVSCGDIVHILSLFGMVTRALYAIYATLIILYCFRLVLLYYAYASLSI